MSFRYNKRINLGKGLGLNVSKSGIKPSYRSRRGSISSRGVSVRTGKDVQKMQMVDAININKNKYGNSQSN